MPPIEKNIPRSQSASWNLSCTKFWVLLFSFWRAHGSQKEAALLGSLHYFIYLRVHVMKAAPARPPRRIVSAINRRGAGVQEFILGHSWKMRSGPCIRHEEPPTIVLRLLLLFGEKDSSNAVYHRDNDTERRPVEKTPARRSHVFII